MPRFSGWCDSCLDFYEITEEEWMRQIEDAIRVVIIEDLDGRKTAGVQLCPTCRAKAA